MKRWDTRRVMAAKAINPSAAMAAGSGIVIGMFDVFGVFGADSYAIE